MYLLGAAVLLATFQFVYSFEVKLGTFFFNLSNFSVNIKRHSNVNELLFWLGKRHSTFNSTSKSFA